MSITYTYDARRNRIETLFDGDVGLADAVNHLHLLSLDPAIGPGADVLLDMRGMTSAPEMLQVASATDHLQRVTARRPLGRCAIAAGSDRSFGVGRMFLSLATGQFTASRIFADIESANAWLDGC